jgi:hypothetical protein
MFITDTRSLRARFGLADLPASVRRLAVVAADEWSEVAEPGLARRPAFVRAQVGNRVVHIDRSADRGGVREHISGITQQQLLAQASRDLIGIGRGMPGRQVNNRFQIDRAEVAEQQA